MSNEIEQAVMKREELQTNAIRDIILNLADCFFRETEDKYGQIAVDLTQGPFKDFINKPDEFNLFFMYPLEQIIEMACKLSMAVKGQPCDSDIDILDRVSLLADVTMRYDIYRNVIGSLISGTEGAACYVDKLHWVIGAYCNWLRTGKAPDMTVDVKCYWKPRYGDAENWIALCQGVYFLSRERIGKSSLEDVAKAHNVLFMKYRQAKEDGVYARVQEAYEAYVKGRDASNE